MDTKLAIHDRPIARALRLLTNAFSPKIKVVDAPKDIHVEWNVPVKVRDGTILRVNMFRPKGTEPVPVIMSAHPYGKDHLPAKTRTGRSVNLQARFVPQPHPATISQWTSWESPDPGFWVKQGYAVVNADLRGGGTSEGVGELFSDEEALDYYDLIEWAGTQDWSSGRVGLDGLSYLAISQYKVAALRPPHLAAICPWEGMTDLYRDFARPGGIREDGFSILWSKLTARETRMRRSMRDEIVNRPERDEWYEAITPKLENIEVPMLICASFSDHNLHTRGAFELFRRAGSACKRLYTHRAGKWSSYYGEDALRARLSFYDHTLKGLNPQWAGEPPVRLAITEAGSNPVAVTGEAAWPPKDLTWRKLWLDALSGTLAECGPPAQPASQSFNTRRGAAAFVWTVPEDLDIIGPMMLQVYVEMRGADDVSLFVGVKKVRRNVEVTFEGSYGFGSDMMSKGWLLASHRELDTKLSTPEQPVHLHKRRLPLNAGEIVPVQIDLRPHATRFRKGEQVRVEIRGRWHYPGGTFGQFPGGCNCVFGQFPAGYEPGPKGVCTLRTGGSFDAYLLIGTRPTGELQIETDV